jgi:sec-independent protein translocase protein TatB
MFDFSWSELALIAAVALIVIGPKDLPRALRTAGMWARKARTISREFQSSIEQMVREAELDDVKKQIESVTSGNLNEEIKKVVDPTGSIEEHLKPPEVPDFNGIMYDTPAIATPPTLPAPASTGAAEPQPALPPHETAPLIAPPAAEPAAAPAAPETPPELPKPTHAGSAP